MLDYVEHEYQMYRDYLAQRHMVSWIYGECNVDKQCLHCVHMKQNRAWATEQLLIGVIKKPIDTVSKQYFLKLFGVGYMVCGSRRKPAVIFIA